MSEKKYRYVALDMRVLLVAVYNEIDWAAYIGAVPGICHEQEYHAVGDYGTRVPEMLARIYFDFDLPWRE